VSFEPGEARGRFTVTRMEGSAFAIEADAIVTAIGQDPDLAPLAAALRANGALLAVDRKQATGVPGVFAGGDAASMAGS